MHARPVTHLKWRCAGDVDQHIIEKAGAAQPQEVNATSGKHGCHKQPVELRLIQPAKAIQRTTYRAMHRQPS